MASCSAGHSWLPRGSPMNDSLPCGNLIYWRNMAIYSGLFHWNVSFSIVISNYQRVYHIIYIYISCYIPVQTPNRWMGIKHICRGNYSWFNQQSLGLKQHDVYGNQKEMARLTCGFRIDKKQEKTTGWWFGTWLLFFHILGMSSSQLTNSNLFHRGWLKPPTRNI